MSALRDRWSAFSQRERLLLMVMGGLALLLILSVLVLRPLAAARTNGVRAFEDAAVTRAAVARAAANGGQQPGGATDLRAAAQESADVFGIVVDRYDFQDGAVDLTVSGIDAPTLYEWLEELSAAYGVTVREGQLRTSGEEGLVSARLTLVGA